MVTRHSLGATDYVVVGASLLMSLGIGIWFRVTGSRQKTTEDFLMGGKDMSKLPVILSITVTMFGSGALLGFPGEVYKYGFYPVLMFAAMFIGTVLAAYVFIPVYFQCRVSTVYEFLELRYGKKMRYTVSALFLIQAIFYMSLNLYGPVLALGAVTDISRDNAILLNGVVVTFYCMLGGLKAVLWTDAFQALLIFAFLILLLSQGIIEAGGLGEMFEKASEGERLIFWDFSLDMTLRYTFWGVCTRGLVGSLAYFGTSQVEAQRMLSLRNATRARSSLLWSTIPTAFIGLVICVSGLIMYGIFHSCDPVLDVLHTGLKKYDQMIPYYIVTRFSAYPGLTGLCVAGIFSGSLSTASSVLNSAAAVTVFDFLMPLFPTSLLIKRRAVLIAKFLTIIYGAICIGLTFAIAQTESIIPTAHILLSIMEGPLLAVFLIAVLSRKGSESSALVGLVFGIITTIWIGYGSLFSGFVNPPLPLSTSECPGQLNSTFLCANNRTCPTTLPESQSLRNDPFILYKISYTWISALGCCVSLIFIFLAILFTALIDAVLELTTPENIAFILHRPSITIAILSDYLREVLQQQNVNLNHITYKKIYLVDLCLRIWNLPPCMEGATVMTFIQNINLSSTYHQIIIMHRERAAVEADAATAVAAATAPAAATAAAAAAVIDEGCELQIDPPIRGGTQIVQQMISTGGIDLIDQEVADEGDGVTTFHAVTRTTGEKYRLQVSNQRIVSIRHF